MNLNTNSINIFLQSSAFCDTMLAFSPPLKRLCSSLLHLFYYHTVQMPWVCTTLSFLLQFTCKNTLTLTHLKAIISFKIVFILFSSDSGMLPAHRNLNVYGYEYMPGKAFVGLTESKNRCRRRQMPSSDVNILASAIILSGISHVNKFHLVGGY